MALLNIQDVSIAFGGPLLLDSVNFQLKRGERVCLLGRNGEGKSTLIRLINNDILPDNGNIIKQPGLRTACLEQEVPPMLKGTVSEIVASGLGPHGKSLAKYHHLSKCYAKKGNSDTLLKMDRIQQELDNAGAWDLHLNVERVLSRMSLDPSEQFKSLSAGLKRRVMLARALVLSPDILLLDEPTNHLDIKAIAWLEDFLTQYEGTILFVTHDRMFLRKLAKRIIELDRGNLSNWECDYDTFLKRKEKCLEAEVEQKKQFKKKLAQEEIWIRKGIKARRVRNQGRVRALEKMRKERQAWRKRTGSVHMQAQEAENSGKLVIKARNINCNFQEQIVIRDFSTTILRKDRIGIIGPNGSGKTTLLKILLGELETRDGEVRFGTKLKIVYFDQLRAGLDENKTVRENIGDGNDTVTINGKEKHVIGYLQDFLFSPKRALSPVKILSGGERNRLLLARLFTKPSNVLVLDEPTNDLDTDTLELLEELLLEYQGTLLLVSHDRAFLNNVVTSTLVFDENGIVNEYAGGYDDWISQRKPKIEKKIETPPPKKKIQKSGKKSSNKLSFNDRRELESLPKKIETMETEQSMLFKDMADPEFYKKDGDTISAAKERLKILENEISSAYQRWEILEDKAS